MSNPTSNFGWQMPTATDLVTDLPADFEVFGQAVDTDFIDLLGGTTGQILSKTSATDLDFTWINNDQGDITGVTAGTGISGGGTSGTVTVTNSMATAITTNGDLLYGTGSGTFSRLGIGSSAQVLTVASGVPSWATPAVSASGLTKIVTANFTTSAGVAVNGCFTSTYSNYILVISNLNAGGNASNIFLQFQYSTSTVQATNYYSGAFYMQANGTSGNYNVNNGTKITLGQNTSLARGQHTVNIGNVGNSSQYPTWSSLGNGANSDGVSITGGEVDSANTYTGLFISGAANISGTYTVYGLEK